MTIIETKNVVFNKSIKYKDLTINKKDFVFLVGKSGSGKSSLLRLINKTKDNYTGEILYKNNNINKLDTIKLRRDIVYVPQEVFLINDDIKNNFKFYYENRDELLICEKDMKKYLKMCCIDIDIKSDCSKLSGGEKQRVFLAIFLSFNPSVLLLDEVTSALDDSNSFMIYDNIRNFCLKNQITVLAISHNTNIVKKYAKSIICIGENDYE